MAEWLKATDCKSVHVSVRRFEPYSAHFIHGEVVVLLKINQAEVAHLVER